MQATIDPEKNQITVQNRKAHRPKSQDHDARVLHVPSPNAQEGFDAHI